MAGPERRRRARGPDDRELGATTASFAVVPGARACEQRPGGTAARTTRLCADPLTHGARAILMEGIGMQGIRPKPDARHECKISYSWRRLGATAALFAAVPGARAFGQRPAGTVMGSMRFRAHSLTHGMRAILTEGLAMERIRRKTAARHECKISYSWRPGGSRGPKTRLTSPVFSKGPTREAGPPAGMSKPAARGPRPDAEQQGFARGQRRMTRNLLLMRRARF